MAAHGRRSAAKALRQCGSERGCVAADRRKVTKGRTDQGVGFARCAGVRRMGRSGAVIHESMPDRVGCRTGFFAVPLIRRAPPGGRRRTRHDGPGPHRARSRPSDPFAHLSPNRRATPRPTPRPDASSLPFLAEASGWGSSGRFWMARCSALAFAAPLPKPATEPTTLPV